MSDTPNTVQLTHKGNPIYPVTDESLVIGLNQRQYNAQDPDGFGYLVLEKDSAFSDQVVDVNTIYEIRYDYDLNNGTVTIPAGCVLRFNGGSISNGTVVLDGTYLDGDIKMSCSLSGTMRNRIIYSSWFNDVPLSVANAQALGKSICVDIGATLTAPLSFFGLRDVEIRGTITNSETNYIEIGYAATASLPCKVDIWNATYVKMTGGKNMMVTVRNANNLVLYADSSVTGKTSIAYCTFNLGTIYNFSIVGNNNGWINENTFIKGRFITTLSIHGDGYSHNHNVFYNPALEGDLVINLDKCQYNVFHDCRFEGDVGLTFGSTASNNRFYVSWMASQHSLWRMYYRKSYGNENGIFFENSTVVKKFTLDRNYYINNGRDLSKVSLCDDSDTVRHEDSGTYARLKIYPKTDFGVVMMSDNDAMSRLRVMLYDQTGANITDTMTSYINSLGTFTKSTSSGGVTYYKLDRDDKYAYLEVLVDNINASLLTIYGVDGNNNPVKEIGYVTVGFAPDNVRKVFTYVDFRVIFPANAGDNAGVSFLPAFALPFNKAATTPSKKSTISGTSVPNSILDGEVCYVSADNKLYMRNGDTIAAIG